MCRLDAPGLHGREELVGRLCERNHASIRDLLANRFDVWSVDPQAGTLLVGGNAETLRELQSAGFAAEVDSAQTEQLAASLAAMQAARAPSCGASPAGGSSIDSEGSVPGIPGYACYRTATEIDVALRALAAAYPTLDTVVEEHLIADVHIEEKYNQKSLRRSVYKKLDITALQILKKQLMLYNRKRLVSNDETENVVTIIDGLIKK